MRLVAGHGKIVPVRKRRASTLLMPEERSQLSAAKQAPCVWRIAQLNFAMSQSEGGAALERWIWRIHAMKTTALIRTITIAIMLAAAICAGCGAIHQLVYAS